MNKIDHANKQNQSMWYYKPHQKIDKNSAMQFAKTEKQK